MKFFFIIVTLLISNTLLAERLQFNAEKLISDYNGITANGSIVICYGDFGIITFSTNSGEDWRQLSLGQEHSIKKIINHGNTFYGVTQNSLIKSQNDIYSWTIKHFVGMPEMISMDINNDKIYILTKQNIQLTNLNFDNLNVIVELNPDSLYSSIVTDNDYLYILEGNEKILKYEISTGILTKTINIKDMNFSNKFSYLKNLKLIDKELFAVIQVEKLSIMPLGTDHYNYNNILIKSSDNGDTWEVVSDSLKGTSCYNKINGDIYIIGPRPLSSKMRIDFKKLITGTKSPELVNDMDGIDRDIYFNIYQYDYKINEIIKITENIWIAAGSDKLILKTVNSGESWEIVSFFNSFYIDNFETNVNVLQITKDIIFVPYFRKVDSNIYFSGFLKTMNGGVTWLPQRYNPDIKIPDKASQYIFNKEGKGVCLFDNNQTQLFSTDYGETFQIREFSITAQSFQLSDRRALDLGDRFLFKYTDARDKNNFTKFYTTDFEKLTDSVVVDSVSFKNLMLSEDSIIYSVGLYRSDYEPPDTVFQYGHYKYQKYFVYKSEDKGKTWIKHSGELPFEVEEIPYNKGWHYYDFMRASTYFNRKIVIPYGHYQGKSLFCIYDIDTKQADSVVLNNSYANSRDVFFIFGNRLSYFSLDNKLNYSSENQVNTEWESTDNLNEKILDDVFITVSSDNEDCFITTGKYSFLSMLGGKGYKVNVVKLQTDTYTSVEKDYPFSNSYDLLEFKPYPVPSSIGWINIQVNGSKDINLSDVGVFDNLGNKLNSANIEYQEVENGKSMIRWYYGNHPSGVYYIHINSGNKKHSVPVIIQK